LGEKCIEAKAILDPGGLCLAAKVLMHWISAKKEKPIVDQLYYLAAVRWGRGAPRPAAGGNGRSQKAGEGDVVIK
jgi:hypothetical protein